MANNNFFDANFNITNCKVDNGEIKTLEINGKDVPLANSATFPLKAWKSAGNAFIYTKVVPTEAGTVDIIKQSPMANGTGTYSPGTPAVKHDIWKVGTSFYKNDLTAGTEPSGVAASPVDLGDIYIATESDTALTEGTWYTKLAMRDDSDKWYTVVGLLKNGIVTGDEVTDADAITALEAATLAEVDYVEYTELEILPSITVSGTAHARYTTGDYTVR